MANPWFRLWSDMVNDPKWRTIAKKSNQRIGDVMAVYLHMMTCASNAAERGRTQGWCDEDVASALDIDVQDVSAIREAMQGRVLDGDYLTGWEKRQPKREDNSSERGKNWRNSQNKTQSEDERTQPNATERKNVVDTDTDTEKNIKANVDSDAIDAHDACPHQDIIAIYHEILPNMPAVKIWNKPRMSKLRNLWKADKKRQDLDYWRRYFTYVSESDFLMGRTAKPFHGVNLEWLVTPANFVKVIERNYENRGAA